MYSNANNAYEINTSCKNRLNQTLIEKNNTNFNTTNIGVSVKPNVVQDNHQRHTLELKRSHSCPSLVLKQEDHIVPASNGSDDSISKQIFKLAIDACTAGERIGIENQRRFCLKNIQILCSKTKEHLKNSEVTKAHIQDTQLMIKNYIFSFIRILDGWKCLEEVLREKHDAYGTIENEYYSPSIRDTFSEWQSSTKYLLQQVYDTFQTLDKNTQGEKKQSKMCKMVKEITINNVRPITNNQTITQANISTAKSQVEKNAEKSFKTFSKSLLYSNCNIEAQPLSSYDDKNYSGQIVSSQLSAETEVPSYVNSSIVVSRSYPMSQNIDSDTTANWKYYSQWFCGENSADHLTMSDYRSSVSDNQWEAALQLAPMLVDNILKTTLNTSPVKQYSNRNNKKVKKKNARNEIKKVGNILTNFLDVELFSKVSNQNINKVL